MAGRELFHAGCTITGYKILMFWSRLPLIGKIFIAIALTSSLIVIVMASMVAFNMRAGFAKYLLQAEINRFGGLEEALAKAHDAAAPGWPALAANRRAWSRFVGKNFRPASARRSRPRDTGAPPPGPRGRDPLNLRGRLALLDVDKNLIAGASANDRYTVLRAVMPETAAAGTMPLGWIRLAAPQGAISRADGVFLSGQFRSLVMAALLALVLSALAALFLARQFLAPLRQLSAGSKTLAGGDYTARMHNGRHDELGNLIDNYNALAASLEAAEQSQRQWITNTSHELQTPLAVLRAEIEALQDGIRKPTPAVLAGLHQSVMRLSHLVGDLNTLVQTREGKLSFAFEEGDLHDIVAEAAELARPGLTDAGVSLTIAGGEPMSISCDRSRMRQVLDNLLENSRRYTTAPGQVAISFKRTASKVQMTIEDSAPAPDEAAFENLFDRFFRAEASRSRKYGGSGLGLSICKAIVEAHGGSITASRSELGGLNMTITLPAADHQSTPESAHAATNAIS